VPIVVLALVFNMTNAIGAPSRRSETADAHAAFTYADRDAKQRWATGMATSGLLGNLGGVGGTVVTGLARSALGKVFS